MCASRNMSGPHDQNYIIQATEQYQQLYGVQGNIAEGAYPGISGPPTPLDGIGFWYRPQQIEPVFDSSTSVYSHDSQRRTPSVEPTVSIKHRRTRSGCFTCRTRRVKCDETRPICERCRKGNRNCEFPQTTTMARRGNKAGVAQAQDLAASPETKSETLETIHDDSDEVEDEPDSPGNDTPQDIFDKIKTGKSPAPPTEPRRGYDLSDSIQDDSQAANPSSSWSRSLTSPSRVRRTISARTPDWTHLKPQVQEFLQFQQDHMSHYHYMIKLDPTGFIHHEFIAIALSFEPLLNAVVAFAAYHYTIQRQGEDFNTFWRYYCRSIITLRKWLEKHTERNEAVLLTVLQLATFEEYMGDWANLSSHHRAAHSIISTLYTYETFTKTETSRQIFDWFARVDVMASLMAGTETVLNRDWFLAAQSWHEALYNPKEIDIEHAMGYFSASLRLLGFDMATVFANAMKTPNFMQNASKISDRLDKIRVEIEGLHGTAHTITEFRKERNEDRGDSPNAFDHRVPLFRDQLWPLNFIWIDWYGTQQMHHYQIALLGNAHTYASENTIESMQSNRITTTTTQLPPYLEKLSLVQCQIYEAIEQLPSAPPGAILGCHIGMALSTVFLRKEPRFTMWARRKLANVERAGYIWPPSFRKRMAQLWAIDEVMDWWLPDGAGKFPLLDTIRGIVEERTRESAEQGIDDGRTDLREIKAIFDRLDLGHHSARKGSSDAASGSGFGSPSDTGSGEGFATELSSLPGKPRR